MNMQTRMSGGGAKAVAFATLEAHRACVIRQARRAFLAHLLRHGAGTLDDVRPALEIPHGVDPVCLGAVPGALARKHIIRRVGYRPSVRAEAHARPVAVWALLDAQRARAWLAAHPEMDAPLSGQCEMDFNEEPRRGNAGAQRKVFSNAQHENSD